MFNRASRYFTPIISRVHFDSCVFFFSSFSFTLVQRAFSFIRIFLRWPEGRGGEGELPISRHVGGARLFSACVWRLAPTVCRFSRGTPVHQTAKTLAAGNKLLLCPGGILITRRYTGGGGDGERKRKKERQKKNNNKYRKPTKTKRNITVCARA